jgi:hypothetical protein
MSNHQRVNSGVSRCTSTGLGPAPLSDGFTPAEVALGQQVRAAYVRERSAVASAKAKVPVQYVVPRRWDGKAGSFIDGEIAEGCKPVGPIWPKISRELLRRRIVPEQYVRWAFKAKMLREPPEPNHLLSSKFLDAFVASLDPARDRTLCEEDFASYRERASVDVAVHKASGSSERDAYLRVATNRNNGLPPLFRYCLAVMARHDGLANKFFPSAAVEYMRARTDYDAVWGRYLPAGFDERAATYYSEVVLGEVPDDAETRPDDQ